MNFFLPLLRIVILVKCALEYLTAHQPTILKYTCVLCPDLVKSLPLLDKQHLEVIRN